MKKSITENFVYSMLYQILVTALPILTTPYTARVLGLHANGIHSYTESIVTYFMLIGAVGTSMYGARKIAYERDNPEKMTKTVWEIILLRFVLLGVTLIVFVATLCINNEYAYLYRIQIINILSTAIDLSWFYQGVEDFKKITIRNTIVKAIYVICLFCFIKGPEDLPLYVILIVGSAFLGNLFTWFYLKEYTVKGISYRSLHIFSHIKGSITLFIPQIMNYVYALLDRSMLKWITNSTDNVGIYDQAQRLIRAVTAVLQSIGYVMMARIANLQAGDNQEEIKYYIRKSTNFTLFLAFPVMFGLMGTAKDFIPLFLGGEYLGVIIVLQLLCPLVLTMSVNGILGMQLLIPVGKEKDYAFATTVGAVTNVLVNIITIPQIGIYGACVSSLLAEGVVFVISFVKSKDYLDIKQIFKDNVIPFFVSIIMYFIVMKIQQIRLNIVWRLFFEILFGGGFYFICMLLSKNETMYLIKEKITQKVLKKY